MTPDDPLGGSIEKITGILEAFFTCGKIENNQKMETSKCYTQPRRKAMLFASSLFH